MRESEFRQDSSKLDAEFRNLRAQVAAMRALARALLFGLAAAAGPPEARNALAAMSTVARSVLDGDCPAAARRAASKEIADAILDTTALFDAITAHLAPDNDTVVN